MSPPQKKDCESFIEDIISNREFAEAESQWKYVDVLYLSCQDMRDCDIVEIEKQLAGDNI